MSEQGNQAAVPVVKTNFRKRLIWGLLLAVPALTAVNYLMGKDLKDCASKDHVKAARACEKVLAGAKFRERNLDRAFWLLFHARHLLSIGGDSSAGALPLLDEAAGILASGAPVAPAEADKKRVVTTTIKLLRWTYYARQDRLDLALAALQEDQARLGPGEGASAEAFSNLIACGKFRAGDLAGARGSFRGSFPRKHLAMLDFLSGDDAAAAGAAAEPGAEIPAALALAALGGRQEESLRLIEKRLAEPKAAGDERVRAGLLAAKGTLLRLGSLRGAAETFAEAQALSSDGELAEYIDSESLRMAPPKPRTGKRIRPAAPAPMDVAHFRAGVGGAALSGMRREVSASCDRISADTVSKFTQ